MTDDIHSDEPESQDQDPETLAQLAVKKAVDDYIDQSPLNEDDVFIREHEYFDEEGFYVASHLMWRAPDGTKKSRWGIKAHPKGKLKGSLEEVVTPRHRPTDGYTWLSDKRPDFVPLYRIREVKAAIARGETVLSLGGEKDVDLAFDLGFTATCNPFGEGRWMSVHNECLIGARVVAIPDEDTTGREHAKKVLNSIRGHAKELRLGMLPGHAADGETGNDLSDWVEAEEEEAFRKNGLVNKRAIMDKLAEVVRRAVPKTFEWTASRSPVPAKTYVNFKSGARYLGYEFRGNLMTLMPDFRVDGGPWSRVDDAVMRELQNKLEKLGLHSGVERTAHCVMSFAEEFEVNPLLEKLDDLKWDGKPRLATWMIDYAGAEDTPLNRVVGEIALSAGYLRLKFPGAKHDAMIVFEGPQGVGKSTLVRLLAMEEQWYSDQLTIGSDPKHVIEQTQGKWMVELAELEGIKGKQASKLKHFLSSKTDAARLAYGRMMTEALRKFVLFGTVNPENGYLPRDGVNRRYWPVAVSNTGINLQGFKRDVEQIWAEVAAKLKGIECQEEAERLLVLPVELREAAAMLTSERVQTPPWITRLKDVLMSFEDEPAVKLKAMEIIDHLAVNDAGKNQVGAELKQLMLDEGWTHDPRLSIKGRQCAGYYKGDKSKAVYFGLSASGQTYKDASGSDNEPM